jgi:hypothetical protein
LEIWNDGKTGNILPIIVLDTLGKDFKREIGRHFSIRPLGANQKFPDPQDKDVAGV